VTLFLGQVGASIYLKTGKSRPALRNIRGSGWESSAVFGIVIIAAFEGSSLNISGSIHNGCFGDSERGMKTAKSVS